ncbi:hypothetical protein Cantr_00671 [Candida viswanathii]|uniref:Sigma-like sequence protein 1, mitochondrial n=1 Tax=Candida viswanathii TaxID=5486 RepID=A0A367YG60_9ASCO|nr:hypothetical protein Cantr_00671 [Candida viswanathii]
MISLSRYALRKNTATRIPTRSVGQFSSLEEFLKVANNDQESRRRKRIFLKPSELLEKGKTRQWRERTRNLAPPLPADYDKVPVVYEALSKHMGLPQKLPTDLEQEIIKSIELLKPIDSEIGRMTFDALSRKLQMAFKKTQLFDYLAYMWEKDSSLRMTGKPPKTYMNKKVLAAKIIKDIWKIEVSDNLVGGSDVSTGEIQLKSHEISFLEALKSHVVANMKKYDVRTLVTNSKFRVTGKEPGVNFILEELKKILRGMKSEKWDIGKSAAIKDLDLDKIQQLADVYFEKGSEEGQYVLYARQDGNITFAKRLLTWSMDNNPHVKDEVFEADRLASAEFGPYVNHDILPWYQKNFEYFSVVRKDHKPMSELVFDKYDAMHDYFVELVVGGKLEDSRMLLGSDLYHDVIPEEEFHRPNKSALEEDVMEEDVSEEDVSPQEETKSEPASNFPDMSNILSNQQKAKGVDRQPHEDLEELRKELGSFSNEDVDVSDFPGIAKLVEDFEAASSKPSDESIEDLRKELNLFTTASEGGFNVLGSFNEKVLTESQPQEAVEAAEIEAVEADSSKPSDESIDDLSTELNLFTTSQEGDFNELTESKPHEAVEPAAAADPPAADSPAADSPAADPPVAKSPVIVSDYFSSEQIDKLYEQLTDISYTSELEGVDKNSILSSAFTVQFGTLLLKQNPPKEKALFPTPLAVTKDSQFVFAGSAPYMTDLVTSLPLIDAPSSDIILIKLVPSKLQKKGETTIAHNEFENYPPVEIVCELDERGLLNFGTLQVISLEAIKNVAVGLPELGSDLNVSRMILGDMLKESDDSSSDKFASQPDLENFFDNSQLKFKGNAQFKVHPHVTLNINGKSVPYEYLSMSRKVELNFQYNGRQVNYSVINGGPLGGMRSELIIGDGELSREEFEKLLNDSILLIRETS